LGFGFFFLWGACPQADITEPPPAALLAVLFPTLPTKPTLGLSALPTLALLSSRSPPLPIHSKLSISSIPPPILATITGKPA
jgi:hypothetical protein